MTTVLLVEDNEDLAYGLANNLEIEGYRVLVATNGPRGLSVAMTQAPDVIILDLMLPGLDGLRVLTTLRQHGHRVPVLILTARGQEADKVRGLKLGADDYLTKPFGILELLARVEALLRRASEEWRESAVPIRFGPVEIHPAARAAYRAGAPVMLTPKEYDLLIALARADGAAVSRTRLLERVWGYQPGVSSRTVDTHMAELRRKLEADPTRPAHLVTVRKIGYRLAR